MQKHRGVVAGMDNSHRIAGFIGALLLVMAAGCVRAGNYYVAPDGNDSNPGTLAAPWKTLKKSLDNVKGGDNVYFRAGTYASARAPLDLHPPAGQWITFKPYQNENVIINTAGGEWAFRGASYIIVEGFEITDLNYRRDIPHSCDLHTSASCLDLAKSLPESGGLAFVGTHFRNARTDSHHIIVRNNEIHHNTGMGLTGGNQGSHDFQILGNHIHHNGYAGLREGYGAYISGTNWLISGNRFHNNSGNNLRIGNISEDNHAIGWIIENNVLYNAEGPFWHSSGNVRNDSLNIALYGSEGSIVRNNILCGCYGSGMWAVNVNPSKPDLIYNNTIYGNSSTGLRLSQGPIMAKNNIVWGNGTRVSGYQIDMTKSHTGTAEYNLVGGGNLLIRNSGSGTERNNIRNADPLFVNPAAGDFSLQPTSSAIDKGVTLAEVSTDFTGKNRPEGTAYDIGVFEGAGSRANDLPGMTGGLPPGAGGAPVSRGPNGEVCPFAYN